MDLTISNGDAVLNECTGGEVPVHGGNGKIHAKHTYDKRAQFPPCG